MSDDGGRWNPDERVQQLEQQAREEQEEQRKQADKERRRKQEDQDRRDREHARASSSSSSSHSRDRSRDRSSSHHRRSSRSRSRSRDRDRDRKHEHGSQQRREWEQMAAVRERGVRRSRTRSRSRSPRREQSKQQTHEQPQSRPAHRANAASGSSMPAAASAAPSPAAAVPFTRPRVDCRNPSTNVMLHSLPPRAVESDIISALEHFFPDQPRPLQVRLVRQNGISKGYAFAEYATIEQAVTVMEMAAGLAASGARQLEVAGTTVGLSFGTQKEGHGAAGKAAYLHRDPVAAAAAAAAATVAQTPWQCSRCGTANDGHLPSCSICNIARVVLEGGEAATIAMSESLTSARTAQQQQKAYHAQQMHMAAMQPVIAAAAAAAGSASAAATVDPMDVSLLERILSGTVLLLTGLSASATPTIIRDALVPFAAVVDVKLALDDQGQTLQPPLAMVEVDSKEDVASLQSKAATLKIEGQTPTMSVASTQHVKLARPRSYMSWAKQQDRTAHPVAANAATAAAAARSAPVRPPGLARSFVWDASSGYWFDAQSGYYFHADTSLYFHAATQTYSKWDPLSGTYVLLDQAGNPAVAASSMHQASGLSAEAAQYLALKTAQALEKQRALEGPNAHPPPLESAAPISFSMARKTTNAPAAHALAPAAAPSVSASSPAAAASASSGSFLDVSRLACLLCNRQLKSVDQLLKHEQLSELHKTNLAAHHAKNGAAAANVAPSSTVTRAPAPAAAAAAPPKSAAELEYLRQMAQHKQLDRDPNATHALLK